jgi:hypothetical protein
MKRVSLSHALVALSLCGVASAQTEQQRGTAESTIDGKKVVINYGQPALKGRTLDSLIAQLPPDRIWRAGVDEVTTLTTNTALLVGGKKVPGGKYSVYVFAPKTGDWALVLNSDPGIELGALAKKMNFTVGDAEAKKLWPHLEGYEGIASKEVARETMKSGTSAPPVDPFKITLKPVKGGFTMTLAWGDRSWSADLQVAP